MKRILSKIKRWGSLLLIVLGLIEHFTKMPILFRPLWVYFNQNIEIKFGIVLLLTLLFMTLWVCNKHPGIKEIKAPENTPDTASNKRWKTSFEKFPKEGILYALEYPPDKEDVEPWIAKSDPRCLKCQTQMRREPVDYNPFASSRWVCKSCGHYIEDSENVKLQTQAKSRLVKKLSNGS